MLMYMVINRNKKKDLVVVDYILGDLPETYFLFRNNPKSHGLKITNWARDQLLMYQNHGDRL